MKYFRFVWLLMIFGGGILGSSLFAGCNNDDPVTPDAQPEIVFAAKESLDVPAEGGPFQIEYTIENPVANATLSAKCNDSWITDIDTKTSGVISFNVTKNETAEKREAIIEVSYADIQPAPSFKVFQIEYTIENPVANATLSAKCNDSWITDIDTKTAGVISFNVTKNETAEKREAIIEVSYADIQPAPSFTAKQAARPEEAFTITISDITTKTFRTTVRPGDQEMYYLLNIIPSRAAADFKTDDELYQYDIDFYTDMDATGSGWQSWAQEYLEQGTIADRLIENMEPDTEYLVYAYGVDPITIERLTPISKKTLTTLAPQTIDTKFDIQIVSTEGLNIDVLVKANDYDGHFVAKIYGSVDAADTDATVLEKISESWIDNVKIYGWMGYTAEMILSQYTFQQSRKIQETLEPNSKYYIYAFAVDDEALRCSDIVFIPITTNDTSIQH
ncbi:BACON domain-containing protein [Alistipes putredinis]|nr:BACON domain-containing carbohydrate-binding protein [Alistipes putredinis]